MKRALKIGAYFQRTQMTSLHDWMPMEHAPRDGSPIEIRCTFGVAPWYGVFAWNGDGWFRYGNTHSSVESDAKGNAPFLSWRPLRTAPELYVDPTRGIQNDPAYWRGAMAAKVGLPIDALEKEAARNFRLLEGEDKHPISSLFDALCAWWKK